MLNVTHEEVREIRDIWLPQAYQAHAFANPDGLTGSVPSEMVDRAKAAVEIANSHRLKLRKLGGEVYKTALEAITDTGCYGPHIAKKDLLDELFAEAQLELRVLEKWLADHGDRPRATADQPTESPPHQNKQPAEPRQRILDIIHGIETGEDVRPDCQLLLADLASSADVPEDIREACSWGADEALGGWNLIWDGYCADGAGYEWQHGRLARVLIPELEDIWHDIDRGDSRAPDIQRQWVPVLSRLAARLASVQQSNITFQRIQERSAEITDKVNLLVKQMERHQARRQPSATYPKTSLNPPPPPPGEHRSKTRRPVPTDRERLFARMFAACPDADTDWLLSWLDGSEGPGEKLSKLLKRYPTMVSLGRKQLAELVPCEKTTVNRNPEYKKLRAADPGRIRKLEADRRGAAAARSDEAEHLAHVRKELGNS